ncbi:MAG: tetratricopeptide repeat protein [Deltaproteobacteria bacterium]|nr:tetratricopeptide repeat protein [Deltaproteobacteria bacterium]
MGKRKDKEQRAATLFGQGLRCQQEGKRLRAEGCYREAIRFAEKAPKIMAMACVNLGNIRSEEDPIDAEKLYRKAMRLTKDAPDAAAKASFNCGELCWNAGRVSDARRLFLTVLGIAPANSTVLAAATFYLALVCAREGRLAEGAKYYSEGLGLQVVSPMRAAMASYNLGIVYQENGRLPEALRYYLDTISFVDHVPTLAASASIQAGLISEQQKRLLDAERHYRRAFTLEAHAPVASAMASVNMGELCREQGRIEEAERHFLRAIELGGSAVGVILKALICLSRHYLKLGQYSDAERHIDVFMCRAVEIIGTFAADFRRGDVELLGEIFLLSADLCSRQGNRRKSVQRLGEATQLLDMFLDAATRLLNVAPIIAATLRARAVVRVRRCFGLGCLRDLTQLVEDLDQAEGLELANAAHRAVPLIDSAWILLASLPLLGRPTTFTPFSEVALLALEKAEKAQRACQCDEEGSASKAPVMASSEVLVRAVCTCLAVCDSTTEAHQCARRGAGRLLDIKGAGGGEVAAVAQLCAVLLTLHREDDIAMLGLGSWTSATLRARMQSLADQALQMASRDGYDVVESSSDDCVKCFRASRAALFRTHIEAHLMEAWVAGIPADTEGLERIVEGEPAAKLFAAVVENRRINELALLRASRGELASGNPSRTNRQVQLERGNAQLELAVGLSYRVEILVHAKDRESPRHIARIRHVGWTNDGLPEALAVWANEYLAFRRAAQDGVSAFASAAPTPFAEPAHSVAELPDSVFAPLRCTTSDVLGWAARLLEPETWLHIAPDSVLHDIPWTAVGASEGVRLSGQLVRAACRRDLARMKNKEALFVLLDSMVASYGGWKTIQETWIRPLERAGWIPRIVITKSPAKRRGTALPEPPEWRTGPPSKPTLQPSLVVWLNHGELHQSGQRPLVPVLRVHGHHCISEAELGAADVTGTLPLPGIDIQLDLSACEAFLSGACMSGRVDPRFGPESVGLVRALMGLGVREMFAPNFGALLTPLPRHAGRVRAPDETREESDNPATVMGVLMSTMIEAVIDERRIGPAVWQSLRNLQGEGSAIGSWWWGHATVFEASP